MDKRRNLNKIEVNGIMYSKEFKRNIKRKCIGISAILALIVSTGIISYIRGRISFYSKKDDDFVLKQTHKIINENDNIKESLDAESHAGEKKEKKFLKIFRKGIRRLYSGITIISSLAVFSGIFLYVIGNMSNYYKTDDDLILDNIQKTIEEDYTIDEIYVVDLHGMGNNSIIVVTCKKSYDFDFKSGEPIDVEPRTQILIFDEVNNGILNQLYNLFGFGSNFSLRFKFALADDTMGASYRAEIDDIIDLNGDGRSEICINFYAIGGGGSAGIYINGIFGYSIYDRKYHLVGTYYNSDDEVDDMTYWERERYYNFYDIQERFNLSYSSTRDNEFFWDTGHGIYLIKTRHTIEENESNADPHTHTIYIYKFEDKYPEMIQMNLIYSGEIPGKRRYCSEEFLVEYIIENNLFDDGSKWEFW